MTDIAHSSGRCWFFHRWRVVNKETQKGLADLLPLDKTTSFEMTQDMLDAVNNRPVIVTYQCVDCGSEKVERV